MSRSKCPLARAMHTHVCFWAGRQGVFVSVGMDVEVLEEKGSQTPLGTSTQPTVGSPTSHTDRISQPHPCSGSTLSANQTETPLPHTQPHTGHRPGRHTQIHGDINKERQHGHRQGRRLGLHTKAQPPRSQPPWSPLGKPTTTRARPPLTHTSCHAIPGTPRHRLMWLL